MSLAVSGAQSAAGAAASSYLPASSLFNLQVWGTFVATYVIERTLDGINWGALTAVGDPVTFTGPCSELLREPDSQARYRINVTAYTSGTLNWGFSP